MRVLCLGGCGYLGSVLVPKLLARGDHVTVFDAQWFGNYLHGHPNLRMIRGDIRERFDWPKVDAVIHLANVANDPQAELDPRLAWEVNALAMMRVAEGAIGTGAGHFLYASSGSVYGVSDAEQVTEDTELVPLSDYNKSKAVAERVLLSYAKRIDITILRPGTVCGVSPRQRLDVTVNKYVMQALANGCVKVEGGKQMRPNVHIEDVTDAFLWCLDRRLTGIYNVGFENLEVRQIARMVCERLNCRNIIVPSNDPRSYRLNSDLLLATDFRPRSGVAQAIEDIIAKVRAGELKDEDRWHNIRAMKAA